MVVVDTSAWIEYFRATGSPVHRRLVELIDGDAEVAHTEAVMMEVLAGARSGRDTARLRSAMLSFPMLRLLGLHGFERAAALQRRARSHGVSLANPVDFLIAEPTIRHGATLLHADADFDRLATCTPLRIEPVD